MRVLLVGPAEPAHLLGSSFAKGPAPRGDGGQPVNDLALHLTQRGHFVTVVSLSSHVTRVWRSNTPGLDVVLIPQRTNPRLRVADAFRVERKRIASVIASITSDVVHAHWPYVYGQATLRVYPSAIVTLHDDIRTLWKLRRFSGLAVLYAMAASTARRAMNVVAVAPHIADHWQRFLRGAAPIAVIPNMSPYPINLPSMPPARSVVSIGHSHPNKNLGRLVAAWDMARPETDDWVLNLIGPGLDGPDHVNARQRDLPESIRWVGSIGRQAVRAALQSASLMVHPSLSEGCPLSVIESLSQGTPVLGHSGAGPIEWMVGEAGGVVDCSDAEALAAELMNVLSSQTQLRVWRSHTQVAAMKFDPAWIVDQHEELYESQGH